MSGGGGGDILDSLDPKSFSGKGNFFENLGTDILNYGLQYSTGGLAGFDGKGVRTGAVGEAAVGGLKEITGAKAAEEANQLAKQQFEETKANAEADRAESIRQTGRNELQKSRMAGAARVSAASRSASKGSVASSNALGSDEKDFLGL